MDEVRLDADFCRNLVHLRAQVALAFAEGAADVDVEFVADFGGEAFGFDDVGLRAVFGRLKVEDAAVFAGDGAAATALGVEVVEVVRGDAGLLVAEARFAAAGAGGVVKGAGGAVEFARLAVELDAARTGALQAGAAARCRFVVFLYARDGKGFEVLALGRLLAKFLFGAAVGAGEEGAVAVVAAFVGGDEVGQAVVVEAFVDVLRDFFVVAGGEADQRFAAVRRGQGRGGDFAAFAPQRLAVALRRGRGFDTVRLLLSVAVSMMVGVPSSCGQTQICVPAGVTVAMVFSSSAGAGAACGAAVCGTAAAALPGLPGRRARSR